MKISWKLIITLALVLLIVWAYISAPAPLPDSADTESTATIAIEDLMKVVAAENDIARALYTSCDLLTHFLQILKHRYCATY